MFDEPSSYLDVKQRLKAARAIRALISSTTYVAFIHYTVDDTEFANTRHFFFLQIRHCRRARFVSLGLLV
jgi:ABC-type cobalamin/Fe3+-siderophores transport system ATPase subunit